MEAQSYTRCWRGNQSLSSRMVGLLSVTELTCRSLKFPNFLKLSRCLCLAENSPCMQIPFCNEFHPAIHFYRLFYTNILLRCFWLHHINHNGGLMSFFLDTLSFLIPSLIVIKSSKCLHILMEITHKKNKIPLCMLRGWLNESLRSSLVDTFTLQTDTKGR